MKYILYTLLLCSTIANAQLLRFATFYTSFSTSAPFSEHPQFRIEAIQSTTEVGDFANGALVETTQVSESNFNVTIGLRKIARFDYQVKGSNFYTGSENESSDYATVSNASGLEYLFEYSHIRNRNSEISQHEYRVRYISDNITTKIAYVDDGLLNLKYILGEARVRKNFGNLDITIGVSRRSHPVYGYSPIDEWVGTWGELANSSGYFSTAGGSEDWLYVNFEEGYTEWIADDDNEFYKYYFGNIVNKYNEDVLSKIGLQQEISGVIGMDYYLYSPNSWIHTWASIYPVHKGLSEYSYDYPNGSLEWDLGFIAGVKINRHVSLFVESRHLKYWDISSYQVKTGINYLIF